jgi:hypothetical protein
MEYRFQILIKSGIIESLVQSESDFSCAPFGYVPYRVISTCECEPQVIDDFWNCVDIVLQNNNATTDDYIRAVRAYVGDTIYGEHE